MPPKAKPAKGGKEKEKEKSDDPKKLKAANAVKVRHILCEKQSKCGIVRLAKLITSTGGSRQTQGGSSRTV